MEHSINLVFGVYKKNSVKLLQAPYILFIESSKMHYALFQKGN